MAKKYSVNGSTTVTVYTTVKLEDSEIEGLDEDEIELLIEEKALDQMSLDNYCGNGGVDKLVGVVGDSSIEIDCEIEMCEIEEIKE